MASLWQPSSAKQRSRAWQMQQAQRQAARCKPARGARVAMVRGEAHPLAAQRNPVVTGPRTTKPAECSVQAMSTKSYAPAPQPILASRPCIVAPYKAHDESFQTSYCTGNHNWNWLRTKRLNSSPLVLRTASNFSCSPSVAQEDCNAAMTLNLPTATQTDPAVGSVEGMQLRVTGDWNTVLAVKGARPLVDGEVFGLTPLKNEQVGLGVSINGDKPQGLRFNDETWGWYLDAETVQWGSEEQRLQFKRQAGDADPALRMTVDSARNQATFWPPDSAALTYDLPAHFRGKALYPVFQVWNSNQAVAVFQSSCSLICGYSPLTLNLATATQTNPAVGSVEGMQLRVTGDWNTVLAVKGARPLVDGEVFGLTPLKNEQVGLGVSINGDKPQGLRFNDETWGWYLDAETVQWGSEEQRLQFKRQAGDADPALRMTVDSAHNQATFWPPDSAALTYDLPAHFSGKALYPVLQVWNSNQAVFQSSCKNLLHTQSSSAFTSQVSREFKLERKSRLALILGILGGLCCLCTLLMLFTRRSSEATARQPSQHTVQPALEPRPQRLTDAELIATYREAQAKFTSSPFHVPTGTVVTSKPFYASAAVAVDEAADGDLVRMWSSEAEAVGLEGQVQGLGLGREHETDEGQVGTETFEQQPGLH